MKKTILIIASALCFNLNAQISTFAGNGAVGYTGDGGQASAATLNNPTGVVFDAAGNLYIADKSNNVIRKVATTGVITTFAGTGTAGFSGDNGQATSATLNLPNRLSADTLGNVYISDYLNSRIRKVATTGIITTVAGHIRQGFSGDGFQAVLAQIYWPTGITFDAAQNMYIVDNGNFCVRKVLTTGIISSPIGTPQVNGYSGDGGAATAAQFQNMIGVSVDANSNIFIGDAGNNRIRKVTTAGVISTSVGTGISGFSGDAGQATAAKINTPSGTVFNSTGNLFISDHYNYRIRKVTTAGVISTAVGTGVAGYSGDGGAATAAKINGTSGLAVDASGNLYIADTKNNVIRKVVTP